MSAYAALTKQIGYSFRNEALLEQALTHRSAASLHNERMEFLGDSVLGLVISTELFSRFPSAREGELSRMRASLVRGETLAEMAKRINLGDFLVLGSGELKSGGFRRESILSDTFEAIIGAIFLDSDFTVIRDLILHWFSERINKCDPKKVNKDPKTRLQEYLQQQGKPLPIYTVTETTGVEHNQLFKVECMIEDIADSVTGEGKSRRKAEQAAAEQILERLGQ